MDNSSTTLLDVSGLSIDFTSDTKLIHAVRNVSFSIAEGERVGLVGESGSGKTTTALSLMRMIKSPGRIVAGSAQLGGIDLLSLTPAQVRDARLRLISYVPQGAMNSLNPVLRIREQILDGVSDHGISMDRSSRDKLVEQVLADVGLPKEVADLFPHELSGGMKQRACIAIAIALKPKLIIADEPTSALDVITQRQVMKTLCRVQDDMGCGLILIGHDMGLMAQVVDRIIVMRDGEIVEDSPVREMFSSPKHDYSKMLISSVPTFNSGKRDTLLRKYTSDAAKAPLLMFRNAGKTFGGSILGKAAKTALEPCSFNLAADQPQIISIVGQSGSGKTTMARMILGLEKPTVGQVVYKGRPIGEHSGAESLNFRREVQAIFQDPYSSFNPFYKVDRMLAEPLRRFGIEKDRKLMYRRMDDACRSVGLKTDEIFGRFPHELSGGQRQRLMIARALLLRPQLIVADEPVSMVDASLRMSILRNIETLKNDHNISVVYITHDLATAYHVSDYVIVLHQGRIVEAGKPEDVIRSPMHPYTQSLVAAIPWPDPSLGWPDETSSKDKWQAPPVLRGGIPGFELLVAGHA